MTNKTTVVQQGEVRISRIDGLPKGAQMRAVARSQKGFIISHSESGHHHILTDGEVLERTDNVPAGMRIFYGILKDPQSLFQDAPGAHESQDLDAGIWEFRISREYDPFGEQARRVAD